MVVVAVAAPLLAPADPEKVQPAARLLPPLSRSAVDGADASGSGTNAPGPGADAPGNGASASGPGADAPGNGADGSAPGADASGNGTNASGPGTSASGNAQARPDATTLHLLGTDSVGRDVLSRLIYGSRVSLTVGFAAMVLSALFGSLVGIVSGYFGGIVESLTGWLVDVQLSFPFLLLAIFLLGALGGGTLAVILILALATWVNYARIVRAQVLSIKNQGYVEAAHATGASVGRVLFVHILPNTLAPICVVASFSMAQAILTEAALSFLGVGLDPSTPSWGTMLNDGRDYLLTAWWISTMPGIAIGFTVLGVMLFGEGLRELLDPRGMR
jgi:peptide/nickel transport system permease protein